MHHPGCFVQPGWCRFIRPGLRVSCPPAVAVAVAVLGSILGLRERARLLGWSIRVPPPRPPSPACLNGSSPTGRYPNLVSTTSTRRRDPAPNELYPAWPWPDPSHPCAPAHEKIRIAAARLATYVADNALSQRQVAERVGLTHVVIFDFVRGHYWPRTLLIAQVETALWIELWPRIGETA